MKKQIITTKNRTHDIVLDDPEVAEWFDRAAINCTDIILDQINNERMYDPVLSGKTDLTILDIGANIGLFSLYAQDSAQKIICLEPTPRTFNILQKLVKDLDKISIQATALGNSNEKIKFYVNDNPTINSLVNQVGQEVEVECRTIASVLEHNNLSWVDFVKCDIEGSEVLAISDATLEPVKNKIGSWFIEVHQTNADTGAMWPGNLEQNRQNLISILKNAGYSAEPIIHDQIFAWK